MLNTTDCKNELFEGVHFVLGLQLMFICLVYTLPCQLPEISFHITSKVKYFNSVHLIYQLKLLWDNENSNPIQYRNYASCFNSIRYSESIFTITRVQLIP